MRFLHGGKVQDVAKGIILQGLALQGITLKGIVLKGVMMKGIMIKGKERQDGDRMSTSIRKEEGIGGLIQREES